MELKKGETIMIDAALHLPASFLHESFSDRSGVPLEFFELYYRGKRLEGEAALASSGIEKGSTVEVKMRGRGGADNQSGKQPQKSGEGPSSLSARPLSPSQVEARKKLDRNAKDAGEAATSTPTLALTEHGSTSGAYGANDALGDALQRPENRRVPSNEVMVEAENPEADVQQAASSAAANTPAEVPEAVPAPVPAPEAVLAPEAMPAPEAVHPTAEVQSAVEAAAAVEAVKVSTASTQPVYSLTAWHTTQSARFIVRSSANCAAPLARRRRMTGLPPLRPILRT